MKQAVVRYIYFLIFLFLISFSVKGQIPEIVSETWYLRSLEVDDEIYYPPYNAEIRMNFDGDTGNFIGTGILNTMEGVVMFNDNIDQLTLSDISITEIDCNMTTCDFENIFFYEFLANMSLDAKTFQFEYIDLTSFVNKRLRLTDSNGNLADFVFDPIAPIADSIFQTWYLFSIEVDIGDTIYYEGEDVPQVTINNNFSFVGEENCWSYDGQLEYVSLGHHDLPYFLANEFNQECNQDGSTTIILNQVFDFYDPLSFDVGENDLYFETFPGFIYRFKNTKTLSVEDFSLKEIRLFPNPTTTTTVIHFEGKMDQWEVYDITGRLIVSANNDERRINLTNFQSGIYILKIKSGENSVIKKIIKD